MFITLEGPEGSGKSTVLTRLRDWLMEEGHGVSVTREPGGSRLGRTLRSILLDMGSRDLTMEAELFLYLADRAQHVRQVIMPALAENLVVLSDRYADSTVVYQGYGRGLDPKLLHQFNEVAVQGVWPDLTLLLDVSPEVGLKRAMARNMAEGIHVSEGRFEAESLAFHQRVRDGYLAWAAVNRARFAVLDAAQAPDDVFAQAQAAVRAKWAAQAAQGE